MTKSTKTQPEYIEKIVPDTSIIIDGVLSEEIKARQIKTDEIIIHEAVLAELEHQANLGKASGFLGLDEIKKLRELAAEHEFKISFLGTRPSAGAIRYAKLGEIDAMIRNLAWELGATLITADKTQARVADARGIDVKLIIKEKAEPRIKLEQFFDEQTMSIHLRENLQPYAKKGKPGKWQFVQIRKEILTQKDMREIAKEIIEEARLREDGFIEIEREGSTIIQLGALRIVITKPPFADGWEITAVRPIKQLSLKDYKLSKKLTERLEKAEGILIAGAPGHGKTTFAQALATFYAKMDKVVKTVEAPRDLQLGPKITQYAISHGSLEEIHDILLLSRPDYTIFDEIRNTRDFRLFADMRLTGIGMVGVVHATQPIDAIQRFIGRIELGMIPHIIDTVIFIKDGKVDKVYSLTMTVKVPSGMTEADLARPVVLVSDFETGKPEYEIYTYGEETVIVPMQETKTSMQQLAAKAIEDYFKKYSPKIKAELIGSNRAIVYVPEKIIPRVIGKKGKEIERIEKELGIKIDIQELVQPKRILKSIKFEVDFSKTDIIFYLEKSMRNKEIAIYSGDELITSVFASKKATIRIKRTSQIGKEIESAINKGKIRLVQK